jgi:ribosomal protein S18 acetylase RimI-like enzyme
MRSLVFATDIDVLAADHELIRGDGYWVVRSPSNQTFWWGNFMLFDDVPGSGDGQRWQRLFAQQFADMPGVAHRTFGWDRVDGARGAAQAEFIDRGYVLEQMTGLIAGADAVRPHPRENREVEVRALNPESGADADLWEQVIAIQAVDPPPGTGGGYHLRYLRDRQAGQRQLFRAGRGAWFVALDGQQVLSTLGIVVTARRARYQNVHTLESHRRRGIASRLVVEAARLIAAAHAVDNFVIVADPDYHAIGIYESVGFEPVETVCALTLTPPKAHD